MSSQNGPLLLPVKTAIPHGCDEWLTDTLDIRHFGTIAELSGHFGPRTFRHQDISVVGLRHFGPRAWTLRSLAQDMLALVPKCPQNNGTILILGSGRIHGAVHNVPESSGRGDRYCETKDRIVGANGLRLGLTIRGSASI